MSYEERFAHMAGVVGTHYDGCYRSHPHCAYALGQDDTEKCIAAKVRAMLKRAEEAAGEYAGGRAHGLQDALDAIEEEE